MISTNYSVLTPAYGRDYTSKAKVEADFRQGKDFVLNSFNGSTTNCSISDFEKGVKVNLRYKKCTSVAVITV